MGRWNGTFKYRNQADPERDPQTGFYVGGEGSEEWVDAGMCQIDKYAPAKQYVGTDGQTHSYTYGLFVMKPFKGDQITIGTEVEITLEDGTVDQFTVIGTENQRRYFEIWG